jgi:hypothetical protein
MTQRVHLFHMQVKRAIRVTSDVYIDPHYLQPPDLTTRNTPVARNAHCSPPGTRKALLRPALRARQEAVPLRGEERDIVLSRIDKELVQPYMGKGNGQF